MLSPLNKTDTRARHQHLSAWLIILVWLAVLALLLANRQNIIDWWRLRNYTPPATVIQLAEQDSMTSEARRIFYINQPAIEDRQGFSRQCPSGSEKTIVLGCYHGAQAGIYLFQVSDKRLDGVVQVTAAHEMLHAAYDRLSRQERQHVDDMLLDYYHHGLSDQRIKTTIDSYRQSEPNDLVNEMHSIFGTEVAKLPAPLEAYYKRYFTNRAGVAAYASRYQGEFTSRQTAVAGYDAQLDSLKTQINRQQDDLKSQQAAIDHQHDQLLAERGNGNISVYNAGVAAYNQLIDDYNARVKAVQVLITQYNDLLAQRNAIALEASQLSNELNSKIAPINH